MSISFENPFVSEESREIEKSLKIIEKCFDLYDTMDISKYNTLPYDKKTEYEDLQLHIFEEIRNIDSIRNIKRSLNRKIFTFRKNGYILNKLVPILVNSTVSRMHRFNFKFYQEDYDLWLQYGYQRNDETRTII